jgi:hypothetical protein
VIVRELAKELEKLDPLLPVHVASTNPWLGLGDHVPVSCLSVICEEWDREEGDDEEPVEMYVVLKNNDHDCTDHAEVNLDGKWFCGMCNRLMFGTRSF